MINVDAPENHLDILQLLIYAGSDLNAFNDYQQTPLMMGKLNSKQ